jgi:acyl-CoA synthetase (AMP-forming)/AMP-acid ligase II
MRSEGPRIDDPGAMAWVGDIPARWARERPDSCAIVVPELGHQMSYAALAAATDRFVEVMRDYGLREGDRIAYLGRNSDLFFVCLFGAIAAGLVLVPLNWRCAPPELAFMLEDSQTALVISDAAFLPALGQAVATVPALSHAIRLKTEGPGSLRHRLAEPPSSHQGVPHDPERICLLMYTSGTTGRPKGVMLTHAALSAARHAEIVSPDWEDWTGQDVILSALPNFHIGGMSWMLIGLIRGLTCVLTADAAVPNLLALIDTYHVTRTFIVPTVLRAMLDLLRETGRRPPGIRVITYGASSISPALLKEAITVIGCRFAQYFGMTEAAGTVTFLSPRDHDLARPHLLASVGRPQCGMAVEIRDETGALLPSGRPGEIWVRTPALMAGYWRQPEATRTAIEGGWYRTGDGGVLDADGYLSITDRLKDMIISGGENIYPVQIENVLRQHEAVRDAAVVGVADERWGERVVAMVERNADVLVDESELIAYTQLQLARYKCPKSIRFVEALPRTAMGKVQRAVVRHMMSGTTDTTGDCPC